MTDTELVAELNRLESQNELGRCEELRLQIVRDELVCRQSESPPTGRHVTDTSSRRSRGEVNRLAEVRFCWKLMRESREPLTSVSPP